jgi:hypothetical protein
LHGDTGQIFKPGSGLGGAVLAVLVVEVDQNVAMRAVSGQKNEDDEIGNQQGEVESVGVIEAAERGVEEVIAEVAGNASGSEQRERGRDVSRRDESRNQRRLLWKPLILQHC